MISPPGEWKEESSHAGGISPIVTSTPGYLRVPATLRHSHLKIHQCLPEGDGREAMCVWEGPSLEEVREAVESVVGAYGRNEYFEAEAKEGVNLPSTPGGPETR